MKKIAFVIPWYGENEPEAIEREVRGVVASLAMTGMEIEILTTCVHDYRSDENVYAVGEAFVNGACVRRFPARERAKVAYESVRRKLLDGEALSRAEERVFIDESIDSPELTAYIADHKDDYAFFVFVPYDTATTFYGCQICPERSILLPCFTPNASMNLRAFRQTYINLRAVVYRSPAEKRLAEHSYDFTSTYGTCIGTGMDTHIVGDANAFRREYALYSPFLLYVGRREPEKNINGLVQYFRQFRHRHPEIDLHLVIVGGTEPALARPLKRIRARGVGPLPSSYYIGGEKMGGEPSYDAANEAIHDLGYLEEADKYNAMAAAAMLCLPSRQERFSAAMMESFLCGRPVLANARCDVTREATVAANGGLYYQNYLEFEGAVMYLLENPEIATRMGACGGAYVRERYARDIVVNQWRELFEELEAHPWRV